MIRVVIADDQALVRGGIKMILETQADIEVVAEAADGDAAVAMTRKLAPDVVLMDIRMPGTDGVQATRAITRDRAPGDRPRVLVVTTFDLDHYVYQALKAGASGFLLKDAPPETLAAAVRTVAAGDALLAPVVLRRLLDEYVSRPEPGHLSPPPELTEREVEVLRLIGRGRSNAEIAADLYLSEATVKTHVTRIFTKLRLRDRAQAVVLAYETGLVTPHQQPGGHQSRQLRLSPIGIPAERTCDAVLHVPGRLHPGVGRRPDQGPA
jgi:DNA-binding NarL/FixJ family response regulator